MMSSQHNREFKGNFKQLTHINIKINYKNASKKIKVDYVNDVNSWSQFMYYILRDNSINSFVKTMHLPWFKYQQATYWLKL